MIKTISSNDVTTIAKELGIKYLASCRVYRYHVNEENGYGAWEFEQYIGRRMPLVQVSQENLDMLKAAFTIDWVQGKRTDLTPSDIFQSMDLLGGTFIRPSNQGIQAFAQLLGSVPNLEILQSWASSMITWGIYGSFE